MLTTTAYLMAWGIYLLAAAGLLLAFVRLTRGWRPVAFRVVLRAVLAVWLLMPAVVEPGVARETLAPVFIVLLFELTVSMEAAMRVLEPMLILTVAVIPVALAIDWAFLRWRATHPAGTARVAVTTGVPARADTGDLPADEPGA